MLSLFLKFKNLYKLKNCSNFNINGPKILQNMHFLSLINYKLSPCCSLFNFLTFFPSRLTHVEKFSSSSTLTTIRCEMYQWPTWVTPLCINFHFFSFSSYRFLDCPSIFHIVSFLWSLFLEYQIHFPFSRSLLFLKTDYQHDQSGESVLSKEIW